MVELSEISSEKIVDSSWFKVMQLIVTAILIPLIFAAAAALISVDRRLAVIEHSRFTVADGIVLLEKINDHISTGGHVGITTEVRNNSLRLIRIEDKLDAVLNGRD